MQKITPCLWFDNQAEEAATPTSSVNCETQAEVDELWARFTEGGEESQCGWLKDKYGLSWQIIPAGLTDYLHGPDPAKSARAVQSMFTMKKIDLAKIRQAYEQG